MIPVYTHEHNNTKHEEKGRGGGYWQQKTKTFVPFRVHVNSISEERDVAQR